jgi:hypothetical protein
MLFDVKNALKLDNGKFEINYQLCAICLGEVCVDVVSYRDAIVQDR